MKKSAALQTPSNRISGRKLWLLRQVIYREALDQLDRHFCAMGMRYMPIKGAYIISVGLAMKIHDRNMVDIDILVEKENYQRAIDYFSRCPRAKLHHDNWYFEQPFHYDTGIGLVNVELACLLNRPERFNLPTRELFERATRKTDAMYLPASEDALSITICHTLVHIAYGFHWAALDDAAMIIRDSTFSWETFRHQARGLRIVPFTRVFLTILHNKDDSLTIPPDFMVRTGNNLLTEKWVRRLYYLTPVMARRLFLELAFVCKPAELIKARVRERRMRGKTGKGA